MVDYLFGKGVSRALPRSGFRLVYSRKSGRVKQILHDEKLFATMKQTGAAALSIYGASLLANGKAFLKNCVVVDDDVVEFVREGKSVFCKFVRFAGVNVLPHSEVAVLDGRGQVIAVGRAIVDGRFMEQFKSGVAVKVREGSSI